VIYYNLNIDLKYLKVLYQEEKAADLNNINNSDMQGEVIVSDKFNKTLKLINTSQYRWHSNGTYSNSSTEI